MNKARIGWIDYTTGQEGAGTAAIPIAQAERWIEAMSKIHPHMLHYLINADEEIEQEETDDA